MFVKRNYAEQLKSNLKWNHDQLIHICMKWRNCLISVADTEYAIYIHYTLIISILILFFKSNWRGGWAKGFLLWNVKQNKSSAWHRLPLATISLLERSICSFLSVLLRCVSSPQGCDGSTRFNRRMVEKLDELCRPLLCPWVAEQWAVKHFQACYTNLWDFFFPQ